MRPSRIARDRLLDGHGREKTDRTLTYFIAHELTHTAVARRVGRLAYSRLESWQREGYADYVGKAGDFDFARTHAGFLAGARELDPRKSGLYLRYHLFAAYLLEARGWTAEELNARPIQRARLEAALRALPPLNAP